MYNEKGKWLKQMGRINISGRICFKDNKKKKSLELREVSNLSFLLKNKLEKRSFII